MKIQIKTQNPQQKINKAVIANPDVTLICQQVLYKGKAVAKYQLNDDNIEITVTDKPWYVTDSMIKTKLNEIFS